jgi:hypothetical protein
MHWRPETDGTFSHPRKFGRVAGSLHSSLIATVLAGAAVK